MNQSRPLSADAAVALTVAAAGLALWAAFVVGRVGDVVVPIGFWLSAIAVLVVAGTVTQVSTGLLASAFFTGPMIAALWTAPRGDGDGLWLLVVPFLAFGGAIVGLIAAGVTRLMSRSPVSGRFTASGPGRATTIAWVVSLAAVVAAGGAVWLRRPDPYPGLERFAASFPRPAGVNAETVHRRGDPLCDGLCGAWVKVDFDTTESDSAVVCENVENALNRWVGVTVRQSEPIHNPAAGWFEVCSWNADRGELRALVSVEDEADRRAVHVEIRKFRR